MEGVKLSGRKTFSSKVRSTVYEESGGVCAHCGAKLCIGENFSIDHIIPLCKGGTNDVENYIALCKKCNAKKAGSIVNVQYYRYASDEKVDQIAEVLSNYFSSNNFMYTGNTFLPDEFTFTIKVPVNYRGDYAPKRKYNIKIVSRVEAFRYLQDYKECLSPKHHDRIVDNLDDLCNPYYRVSSDGNTLMYFSSYYEWSMNFGMNLIHMDLYLNRHMQMSINLIPSLYDLLNGILRRLYCQYSMTIGSDVPVIAIKVIGDDKLGNMLLDRVQSIWSEYKDVVLYDKDDANREGSFVRCIYTFDM